MSKDPKDNIESLEIARNKKKSEEGRLRNLAYMYVSREIDKGPFYASMWLYTELQRLEVPDLEEAFKELTPYVEECRKDLYI